MYLRVVTCAQLFDFDKIGLERIIDPGEQVMTTQVIRCDTGAINVDCHCVCEQVCCLFSDHREKAGYSYYYKSKGATNTKYSFGKKKL